MYNILHFGLNFFMNDWEEIARKEPKILYGSRKIILNDKVLSSNHYNPCLKLFEFQRLYPRVQS